MAGFESESIKRRIVQAYIEKTNGSKKHDTQAKRFLPGGDTRSATYFFPHPLYMVEGKGCRLYDCDGNEYIDFLNNYTSLIHGHAHPCVVDAAHAQLERGTVLGSPAEIAYRHAEILCDRIPSMESVRYCNSGTEATLFAIRAARAFTEKDVIVKMEGGYHGSHDLVEVNIVPDMGAAGMPAKHVEGAGIPESILDQVLVVPFNDLHSLERLLESQGSRIAAVILEPMLGSMGMIPPQPGYLKGVRTLADEHGVLVIFDEVVTFRLSTGGLQMMEAVMPDLTALGKIIGGGFPVGAFGGRREIMAPFDPGYADGKGRMGHSGTFNGNNITMAAGVATLESYSAEAVDRINGLGDRLRAGFNAAFEKAGIRGQCTGIGSLLAVHFRGGEITSARESIEGMASSGDLARLLHLEMINRGVYSASRGMYVVSTPMTESEIDTAVGAFEGALEILRPYVEEVFPHLLAG